MVDLKILERHGCTPEKLREIFTKPENRVATFEEYPNPTDVARNIEDDAAKKKRDGFEKRKSEHEQAMATNINMLRNRLRLRIQNGWDENLSNWKPFWAIKQALDVPMRKAIAPTMLATLTNREFGSEEEVVETLSAWGYNLNDVCMEVPDSKVDGKSVYRVSAPAFYEIVPPLVLAYTTIRQATIMNSLLQTPYFQYYPAHESIKSRLQCDVITSRVELMHQQYDYHAADDQGVAQMLRFGRGFRFVMEEWHSEEQEVDEADDASQDADGNPLKEDDKNGGAYYRIQREGLRYHYPEPERLFWDKAFPPCTFLTDSGCQFAGYWGVFRYRDVVNNPNYFNKTNIVIGNYPWQIGWRDFFNTIYPNTLKFPDVAPLANNDRESLLSLQVYTTDMGDRAIVLTEYFEKLIPADYDLGTYKYPVWFRFVVAGDDTIIYAAPLPYCPVTPYLADTDQAKDQTSCLALEVLPWQNQFGIVLSNYVSIIKNNLANITFVDKDMVKEADMTALKGMNERLFRKRNYIEFSGQMWKRAQYQVPNAFYSHQFPPQNAQESLQGMKTILDVLDRLIQMSPQELGQAASHEQSKGEVMQIVKQTSTRLVYTQIPVHKAREATKRQIYQALMAYGEESFMAEVPMDQKLTPELLEEMGFEFDEEHLAHQHHKKLTIRAHKSALAIERFAAAKPTDDRQSDVDAGMAMLNFLDRLLKGPMGPAVGTEQGIEMLNQALRQIGWPSDFKVRNMTPKVNPEQQAQETQKQMQDMIKQVSDSVMGEMEGVVKPLAQHVKQVEQAVSGLTQIVVGAGGGQPPGNGQGQPPMLMPPGGGMRSFQE